MDAMNDVSDLAEDYAVAVTFENTGTTTGYDEASQNAVKEKKINKNK